MLKQSVLFKTGDRVHFIGLFKKKTLKIRISVHN